MSVQQKKETATIFFARFEAVLGALHNDTVVSIIYNVLFSYGTCNEKYRASLSEQKTVHSITHRYTEEGQR